MHTRTHKNWRATSVSCVKGSVATRAASDVRFYGFPCSFPDAALTRAMG